MITGAEILVRILDFYGIRYLFSYPGESVSAIYSALEKVTHGMRLIVMRHEADCCYAADGYFRVSGHPSVVLVTSGPGVTGAISGLFGAYKDRIPFLCISGQVSRVLKGKDVFQYFPTQQSLESICHKVFCPVTIGELFDQAHQACCLLTSSVCQGPIVLDVSSDLQAEIIEEEEYHHWHAILEKKRGSLKHADASFYSENIKECTEIVEYLMSAHNPLIYAGGGVVYSGCEARARLVELCKISGIPCVLTLSGLSLLSSLEEACLGMGGDYGAEAANQALSSADVILALGVRFDDRSISQNIQLLPRVKIIYVDINPDLLGKMMSFFKVIQKDIAVFLNGLLPLLRLKKKIFSFPHKALEKIEEHNGVSKIRLSVLFRYLSSFIRSENCTVSTDVGCHQMWAAHHLSWLPFRGWLTSGGGGCMGYGIPSAVGACFARGGEKSLVITGDGSLLMSLGGLSVLKQYSLPVVVILLNNLRLGMVKGCLHAHKDLQESYGLSLPNFSMLFRSFGGNAICVEREDELEKAFDFLRKTSGFNLLEVRIDSDEPV